MISLYHSKLALPCSMTFMGNGSMHFRVLRIMQLFREWLSNWKALKRTRQYRKAWSVVVVHCCIVKFTSFQRDGRRCYEYLFACVKRNKMDSELLLKFIVGIVAYALTLFWTTIVETVVYQCLTSDPTKLGSLLHDQLWRGCWTTFLLLTAAAYGFQ